MTLVPILFALFAALLLSFAAGRSLQDSGLLMSQQASRLLAMQRAQWRLDQAALIVAGQAAVAGMDQWAGTIETLPIVDNAELPDLPLQMQRVTVVGEGGSVRIRLQADFVVTDCDSEQDEPCMPRARQIAWRQLPPD